MTQFTKIRLIAGKCNCSDSLFLLAKSIIVVFLYSSEIKKYDSSAIRSYNYNGG